MCYTLWLFLTEEQAEPADPHPPLQPPDGELLPLRAVLRPLLLLPLPPVQHHLQLLENELPVLQEDIDEARDARTHAHACTDSCTLPTFNHCVNFSTFQSNLQKILAT